MQKTKLAAEPKYTEGDLETCTLLHKLLVVVQIIKAADQQQKKRLAEPNRANGAILLIR